MMLYDEVICEVFRRHNGASRDAFEFERQEFAEILRSMGETVRNLGDIVYTYRSGRQPLPDEIAATGNWLIEGRGRGRYAFVRLERSPYVAMPTDLQAIDILDATPDIILKYRSSDEQGLLTRIRYNRLVDTFLRLTAYHLQGHVRATVEGMGQVEVDDLYLGVDKDGGQYVIPIEAKTADEPLGVAQIVFQNAFAQQKYPMLKLRSVAVKSWHDKTLFFLELNRSVDPNKVEVIEYRRYRLVREE